ncbi:hypothetical protein IT402_00365 [Candidatus Nomurabacteria bacterium]|nr:hypothetical protein [Candidatus Nomurabacteria bacterium]
MKTVIITVIAILIIAIFVISYFKNKSYKNQINKKRRDKQNQKNIRHVSEIILGSYLKISGKKRRKSIRAFARWQTKENNLWDNASKDQNDLIIDYMLGKEDKFSFTPIIEQENPCKKSKGYPDGYELFIKNAFTDPFPSLHDMPEWAISNKLSEIFIVYNISPEDSSRYLFHLKNHYANHKMTQAIIQFDLWKISEPKIKSRFENRLKQFTKGTGDW